MDDDIRAQTAALAERLARLEALVLEPEAVSNLVLRVRPPFPTPGDPAPIDLSRLSAAQLQLALHAIAAERIRLEGVENLVRERLAAGPEEG